jgi:DNA-binding NtrC family response regulator
LGEHNKMEKCRILLVDDDPYILEGIGADLEGQGFHVTKTDRGNLALQLLQESHFDLVITDLVMEDTDGLQVLKKTKELNADTMVIILTGYGDMKSAIEALRQQADDYLLKPCESEEMFYRVNRCLEKRELARKLKIYQKILPMCCVCKKIRDDRHAEAGKGPWVSVEQFIHDKAQLDITSSYCPECAQQTMQAFTKKKVSPTGK